MTRTPTRPQSFRLSHELHAQLDAHAERFSRQIPGLKFTKADVVKSLLTEGLALPIELHVQLEAFARQQNTSKSDVMIRLLNDALARATSARPSLGGRRR